jgi:hypothetical protein
MAVRGKLGIGSLVRSSRRTFETLPKHKELLYCLALKLYALVLLAWIFEPQPDILIYLHGLHAEEILPTLLGRLFTGIFLTLLVGRLLTELFLTLFVGRLVTEMGEFLTQVRHTLLDVAKAAVDVVKGLHDGITLHHS